MKITEIFEHNKRTFSFEFFPPKTQQAAEALYSAISDLRFLNPDFVSVTYGAGGSTRERTIDLTAKLIAENRFNVMAHLTCIGHSVAELESIIQRHRDRGVKNILALRGDVPAKGLPNGQPADALPYASDLVSLIRKTGDFCIGVAGYPEGHPQSASLDEDIDHLKRKIDAGADFVITQLFYDNHHYFNFVERCRSRGINCRIIPGVLPLMDVKQVDFVQKTCGAHIPPGLLSRLQNYKDDPLTVAHIGMEHAQRQARWLLDDGAPGIHFYTLNHSLACRHLMEQLRF